MLAVQCDTSGQSQNIGMLWQLGNPQRVCNEVAFNQGRH